MRFDKGMKTADVLLFWDRQSALAKHLGIADHQISRYVKYGFIDEKYSKKIKQGIRNKMKKLNRLAEEILK